MFSGIIVGKGAVRSLTASADAAGRLIVDTSILPGVPGHGESISVQGVCLTVVEHKGTDTAFDLLGETVRRTTLGALGPGSPVNLEPALRVGDQIGGHHVQGHVDEVGTVTQADDRGDELRVTIRVSPAVHETLVPQGWVAVDGVSLTVAALASDTFTVALIPTTRDLTTLGALAEGDRVNVEGDPLGKHVRRWMQARAAFAPARS